MSVIVGPNGSGKSNVTDAVLWALGEQSPVAVRGQSMQDVIFGGAPGRQAGKGAEVELVLDDSDGTLGLGAPEISIVRRLDRTGEGEYRLAGARCRLVDVIELLSDTGLGKEMHSVISQGRVEAIVTSKPRDRRLLIEEAAGLGKHRKRRRRAQLKLGRTQDNLDRALDVEREARSRLRPLKRQAEAAELHARLERQTLEARWELARDDLRAQREAAGRGADRRRPGPLARAAGRARARAGRQAPRGGRGGARARSAQREELSRRRFAAQSAGERVAYRTEAVRAVAARIDATLERSRGQLAALEAQVPTTRPTPEAEARIAALERELEALERDREAELARQLAELEQQLEDAQAAVEQRATEVDLAPRRPRAGRRRRRAGPRGGRAGRARGRGRAPRGRPRRRRARRRQPVPARQTPPPGGASALADELEVDAGYELALAAALDGRLGAAIVADRARRTELLDRAGAEGGRALVAAYGAPDSEQPATSARAPGAERLADDVRGGAGARVARAARCSRDAWVVESLERFPRRSPASP